MTEFLISIASETWLILAVFYTFYKVTRIHERENI
jgi:hypothetical protein